MKSALSCPAPRQQLPVPVPLQPHSLPPGRVPPVVSAAGRAPGGAGPKAGHREKEGNGVVSERGHPRHGDPQPGVPALTGGGGQGEPEQQQGQEPAGRGHPGGGGGRQRRSRAGKASFVGGESPARPPPAPSCGCRAPGGIRPRPAPGHPPGPTPPLASLLPGIPRLPPARPQHHGSGTPHPVW